MYRTENRAALRTLEWRIWARLEALAGDVTPVKEALREMNADKYFDDTKSFGFPDFQARAYRRRS